MVKILRINMKTKQYNFEELKKEFIRLGGRALIANIMLAEVNPACHPLEAENKIIFANGLFIGTPFPCPGRLSIGGKSPLTGGIKESNVGGLAATRMSQLGLRAIIIEDTPKEEEWYLLVISKSKVEFVKAAELKGKGNYETVAKLRDKWGPKIATLSIGPAGEQLLAAASVAASDLDGRPARHAGRGGLGTILGSKKVKALVLLRPTEPELEPLRDPEELKKVTRELNSILIPKKRGMTIYGTAGMVSVANEIGGLPTKNYRFGSFDQMEKISGEALYKIITSRKGKPTEACSPGCVIRCSNMYVDKNGEYLTSGFEYETIALNGSNLLIGDLDILAQIDRTCDDIGVDTIEMGNAIAVAMEAGLLKWGDGQAVVSLLREIGQGTLRGKLIASGATNVGKVLGVARVPAVRGQGLPAYDPRAFKAMGVTFATSPMGADHTSGPAIAGRTGWDPQKDYGAISESKGKIELARELQVMVSLCDAFGFCFFVGPDRWILEYVLKAINAKFDWNFTFNDLIAYGKNILRIENEFNKKAGVSEINRLPDFFYKETLPPHNNRWDISEEQLKDFQAFFST
ncbi:MAG TPA: aldehyde ferredoxin oxidoreductase C-terminal domain-containing protein [Candidatus Deferrimicrobium sp.]|nr:aldehyde ferredoxin oxidoreductase C-terminal domain-containing protein [Candidatus Deferrimicrobium sp.]